MKLSGRPTMVAVENWARRNSRSRFIDPVDRAPADAFVLVIIAVRTAIASGSGLKFQKSPTYDSSGTIVILGMAILGCPDRRRDVHILHRGLPFNGGRATQVRSPVRTLPAQTVYQTLKFGYVASAV